VSYFSGTLSIFLAVAEARPLSTEPPLIASPIFINGSKVMMSQSNPAPSSRIYAFTPSHSRQETSNFRGQIARLYEHRSDIAVRGPCLRAILLKRNCPGWQMSLKFLTARKVRGSDTPTQVSPRPQIAKLRCRV